MLLYHGMYNVAHFEINNSVPLYTNTVVGDAYDYKRLRKVCFESGGAYINSSTIGGGKVRGGARVTIQEDSIFMSIVPETGAQGIVIGLTFFLDENDENMLVYAEKRSGGGGDSGVQSWNGRDGNVIPADGDYNGGMVDYDNSISGLISDDVQGAIDELAQESENLSDDIEDAQEDIGDLQTDVTSLAEAVASKENAPTILTGTLVAGQTSVTISNAAVMTTAMYDFYTDVYGVAPTAVAIVTGSITLTFEVRQTDLAVKVVIR